VNWATSYKLLEDPDGSSGYTQVGSDIAPGNGSYDHRVALYARANARYILQSCDANGCFDSSPLNISGNLVEAIGYCKASNPSAYDELGRSVSLSADGNTLAVGASRESSSSTGVNSTPDERVPAAGAVYVFTRSSSLRFKPFLSTANRTAVIINID